MWNPYVWYSPEEASDAENNYTIVFDVVRSDGKWLGVLEYDPNKYEMIEDLQRLLKKDKITFIEKLEKSEIWSEGHLLATVIVDSPYYRSTEIGQDDCKHCGTRCELKSLAWVCRFHGVQV